MLKMKKILYIILAIAFVFSSCSEIVDPQDEQGKDCITLTVFNSPMTKATDIGLEYERNLSGLDVFFYVKGQSDKNCVYYQYVDDPQYLTGNAKIPFYVVEEQINEIFPNGNTTCDVFVIANLPAELRTFDTNPENGYDNTEFNRLSAMTLNLAEGNYDCIGKDFIMAGMDGNIKKDLNNNASGSVKLVRASSKITVSVNIPEKIVLDDGKTMLPVLTETIGTESVVTLKTALHNGVSMGYVYPSGIVDGGMTILPEECYFHTEKARYTYVKDIPGATADDVKKKQYTCDIPFYSYSSVWEKGGEHAAYLTLELPWKNQESQTTNIYYYQILVNGGERRLNPNCWYDLTVNVGVIGSTVEAKPMVLHDMSFYVLDWTTEPDPEDVGGGDRYEDLEIEQYTYFSVNQRRIEMNNTDVGVLDFQASHGVRWALEWPTEANIIASLDQIEKDYNNKNGYKFAAYYLNSGATPPVAKSLVNSIGTQHFSLSSSGQSLIFNYPSASITDNIFAPTYVHVKVWLDIDGAGNTPNGDEVNFVEYVTFVRYPAMYVVPDESTQYSVYVNKYHKTSQSHDYIKISNYDLGGAPGVDSDNNRWFMNVISVSSFSANDKFTLDGKSYSYIIGDPRVRKKDLNLNNDNYNMLASSAWNSNGTASGWATDYKGDVLGFYYPTAKDGESFRIVAPKFRISSKLGGYSGSCHEGAAMRCASYQEDGYPAGRWRLPTTAEIMFIVDLQSKGAIQYLFYQTSWYFSATHRVQNNNGVKVDTNLGTDSSVRCVYDDWYWGSEREAAESTSNNPATGDEYQFTWGDRQIWPE